MTKVKKKKKPYHKAQFVQCKNKKMQANIVEMTNAYLEFIVEEI